MDYWSVAAAWTSQNGVARPRWTIPTSRGPVLAGALTGERNCDRLQRMGLVTGHQPTRKTSGDGGSRCSICIRGRWRYLGARPPKQTPLLSRASRRCQRRICPTRLPWRQFPGTGPTGFKRYCITLWQISKTLFVSISPLKPKSHVDFDECPSDARLQFDRVKGWHRVLGVGANELSTLVPTSN